MPPHNMLASVVGLTAIARAASITDLCTASHVNAALPANGTFIGNDLLPALTTTSIVYNATSGRVAGPGSSASSSTAGYPYCNVTITYARPGKTNVVVRYAMPNPTDFKQRFYVAGGSGYSLPSSYTDGLPYGAVGGITDGGYDAFNNALDAVVLHGNGSINWDAVYMFSYQALGEMTRLGKYFAKTFYGVSNNTRLYTYFEGCSDGGRQAMSQAQRWSIEYDGVIAGAPAFRQAQQQVGHLVPGVIEHTMSYYPPPCELAKIVNETIAACDPLDGRTDGIISRTDLCKLQFDMKTIIGKQYNCSATTSTSLGFGFSKRQTGRGAGSTASSTPAQSGKVTVKGVAVAQAIVDGLHNSKGQQAYLSWQIGSEFSDAATSYNNQTKSWGLEITSLGGEFVTKFVELLDLSNLSTLDGVTYDTVVGWMQMAYDRYYDSLQTTLTDLTEFKSHGGKLLHYHGESDPSVPSGSSVHYWQSVKNAMYPNATLTTAANLLQDWYQFYLVPGAAHCGTNPLQPGVFPETNMDTMIAWVEDGVKPSRLNATATSGYYANQTQLLCQWPQRPLWKSNSSSSTFDCVFDQPSYDSWTYSFPAFKTVVY